MTNTQAIRIAIEAIQAQVKRLAVDANLHDLQGATYPRAINASQERRKLREAITQLESLSEGAAIIERLDTVAGPKP